MSTISNSSSYGFQSMPYSSIAMELNNSKLNSFNNSIPKSTLIILSNKKNSKLKDSIVKQIKISLKLILSLSKILSVKKNTILSYSKKNPLLISNNLLISQNRNLHLIMMTLNLLTQENSVMINFLHFPHSVTVKPKRQNKISKFSLLSHRNQNHKIKKTTNFNILVSKKYLWIKKNHN